MKRVGRWLAALFRWILVAMVAVLVLIGIALAVVETGWGKNRLRELIVREGNQYLTATLEIGRLQGSLLRGIQLSDVRLSRDGDTIIQIDDVSVEYSIRELIDRGTSVRRIRLARPHVVVAREPDGRWNLGALIKRDTQREERRGPGRPLHLMSIEVTDGHVVVREPLKFGASRPPTEYEDLDLALSFDYEPVDWQLVFSHASWKGHAPELTVGSLTGTVANGSGGWRFTDLVVDTPKGHLTVTGAVDRSQTPSVLRFNADAERFAFQEWAPILPVISRIGVTAGFKATLDGPPDKLKTVIDLASDGGDAQGTVVLNTTVPGWRFAGTLDLNRLNLASWLSRPEDRSDISGNVQFDLGIRSGARFPNGTYDFKGSHAAFMGYEADDVRARGHITAADVIVESGTATAYGANVTLDAGRIGIDSPYTFNFAGLADGVDLRMLPESVPVPHVESTLHLRYDVTGQFSRGFLIGAAVFGPSEFLGASIAEGATGAIDTQASPFVYNGRGDLSDVDLNRFGAELDVAWLQEPRYDGTLAGHFEVEGSGSDAATMTLNGGGQIVQANLFGGTLSNADVSIAIADGTLTGSYDGEIADIDPALAFDDPRYAARLTGAGAGRVTVADLLTRSPELKDYTVAATLRLQPGTVVRGVELTSGDVSAALNTETLTFNRMNVSGPAIEGSARGTLELDGRRSSAIDYTLIRSDLARLRSLHGRELEGDLSTQGQLTGPWDRVRFVGDGTLSRFRASGVDALTTTAHYDATVPTSAPEQTVARVDGRMSLVEAAGQQFKEIAGSVNYDAGTATVDLQLVRSDDLTGAIAGRGLIHRQEQTVDLQTLTLTIAQSTWTLAAPGQPRLAWNDRGIVVTALDLVDGASRRQRVSADGTWYTAGDGALRVTARDISLDALFADGGAPSRFGGTLGADATVRGTRDVPIITGEFSIVDGRVYRTPFQRLGGRTDYRGGVFDVDVRLDQGPGVWLTATGSVPLGLFVASEPDLPINLAVASSSVSLGLIQGMTTRVRNVSGTAIINVKTVGTARDPHFDGRLEIQNAAFVATQSGGRYKNGRVALSLAPDRVTVEQFHLEDNDGDPLDLSGSLATHELRVGDLVIDLRARQFEVLRNEYGTMDIDAAVNLRGQFESPRLSGRITVTGGELAVDSILDRTLFQPYATTAAPGVLETDAIAALNPWDRLGLDIQLNVPNTLRLVGDNVQVTPGTPVGLGDINLRALGDLYLYKDPAQPLYINGSLDSVTGTYRFQGRSFDLDPTSSITFRGDLNPELYVTVRRDISGVETRVTIAGPLEAPELRLASTPPLDPSDILSLIVFNTSTNQLSALEQQQLAVRAGTLAAGFLTAPLVTALERSLGLDTLEIEPVSDLGGAGTRVTIGNEIAPGLVARFSRQFGETEYDEATIEYYLSRILRIRATFSDATGLSVRSPFRRVERAGIDLLLFFSF